ncbi:MAG: hypothetical protein HC830_06955, partial [Bacteroidetes bacterium]|nr:hypothetical protein [Bacteroidota bacterium]
FRNIEALETANMEQLLEVGEIGERIARSVLDYFSNTRHQEMIQELKVAGIQFKLSEEETSLISEKLSGSTIVVSGTYKSLSRDQMKNLIENMEEKMLRGYQRKQHTCWQVTNPGLIRCRKLISWA